MDLQVGSLGVAVEVQREVVRREDLAERQRGRQPWHRRDEPVVHPVLLESLVDEPPEGVVPCASDDGGATAVSGGRHRHVGGAAAEIPAERLDVLQRHAHLVRVDVDAHPSHRDEVEGHRTTSARKSRLLRTSSQGPPPSAGSSVRTVSCSITYQPSYPALSSLCTMLGTSMSPSPSGRYSPSRTASVEVISFFRTLPA